jgi:hypothetical protein
MTKEFPLQWPEGWPRSAARKEGKFVYYKTRLSFAQAEKRARDQLRMMGYDERRGAEVILSSNVIRDREPKDPGVALYFQKEGAPMRVIAIDIYIRAADNVAAIAATLEALRAIERHGGGQILERAFTGFDALPPPGTRPWREVFGVRDGSAITLDEMEFLYRNLAKARHPDSGTGTETQMQELNQARIDARRELGGAP